MEKFAEPIERSICVENRTKTNATCSYSACNLVVCAGFHLKFGTAVHNIFDFPKAKDQHVINKFQ